MGRGILLYYWSDVTTGEVGSMVREAIKHVEQAIKNEAKANGEARQTFNK